MICIIHVTHTSNSHYHHSIPTLSPHFSISPYNIEAWAVVKKIILGSEHFHALAQFVHAERDQLVQAYLH